MKFFEDQLAAAQRDLDAAKNARKILQDAMSAACKQAAAVADDAWFKVNEARNRLEDIRIFNDYFQESLIQGFPPKEGVWLCLLEDKTGQFVRTISWNQRGLNDEPEGWYLAGNSSIKKIYQDFKIVGWYPVELPNN